MKSILFIHQSAELYGSDKTILMFISELDKTKYYPVVVLPFEGPLKEELEKNNIKVVIAPVLKLYRKMFTPKNLVKIFKEYKDGIKMLDQLHQEHDFKLVYSHTLAALIGILFAKKRNIKHLWHVQEIIATPKIFNRAFKKILAIESNHKVVYDSKETMNFWIENNKILTDKSEFVWNGIDVHQKVDYSAEEINKVRKDYLLSNDREIVIALVGRINSWKGQQLLLSAFHILTETHSNIKLVFLGSAPPNQEIFETNLKEKIREYHLEQKVTIIPFQKEIGKFWDAIDIAVVPSTQPEPFGMVVIEAMLSKKPVVASNHGGPTEIVIDDETGFLFIPNNENSLAEALNKLIVNPELRKEFGIKGHQRAIDYFSLESHVQHFERIFEEII
ncbi:glycosyltransferase family 4 protein [Flavobacterium sp. GT3R68]|uniref:glycosyltransferase family 4 protein n=1 Tax=Flavobacterium sp. GT3R68 TaxID=2594437 RepID=UPI000F89B2A5|nr:glycosyltransferase family 4 protein [Flavobacterium sp. GT3R68]RTY95919.1 glycosyltransferase family 1 protein [Flavobacterium sp. GSN2]TRW93691.1 glycosyltransferase family 4 protein [Flavobacterium sp. GT3R68]